MVHPYGYNKFLVKKTQDLDGMNKSVNITGKENFREGCLGINEAFMWVKPVGGMIQKITNGVTVNYYRFLNGTFVMHRQTHMPNET